MSFVRSHSGASSSETSSHSLEYYSGASVPEEKPPEVQEEVLVQQSDNRAFQVFSNAWELGENVLNQAQTTSRNLKRRVRGLGIVKRVLGTSNEERRIGRINREASRVVSNRPPQQNLNENQQKVEVDQLLDERPHSISYYPDPPQVRKGFEARPFVDKSTQSLRKAIQEVIVEALLAKYQASCAEKIEKISQVSTPEKIERFKEAMADNIQALYKLGKSPLFNEVDRLNKGILEGENPFQSLRSMLRYLCQKTDKNDFYKDRIKKILAGVNPNAVKVVVNWCYKDNCRHSLYKFAEQISSSKNLEAIPKKELDHCFELVQGQLIEQRISGLIDLYTGQIENLDELIKNCLRGTASSISDYVLVRILVGFHQINYKTFFDRIPAITLELLEAKKDAITAGNAEKTGKAKEYKNLRKVKGVERIAKLKKLKEEGFDKIYCRIQAEEVQKALHQEVNIAALRESVATRMRNYLEGEKVLINLQNNRWYLENIKSNPVFCRDVVEIENLMREMAVSQIESRHLTDTRQINEIEKVVQNIVIEALIADSSLSFTLEKGQEAAVRAENELTNALKSEEQAGQLITKLTGSLEILEYFYNECAHNVYNKTFKSHRHLHPRSNEFCERGIPNHILEVSIVNPIRAALFPQNQEGPDELMELISLIAIPKQVKDIAYETKEFILSSVPFADIFYNHFTQKSDIKVSDVLSRFQYQVTNSIINKIMLLALNPIINDLATQPFKLKAIIGEKILPQVRVLFFQQTIDEVLNKLENDKEFSLHLKGYIAGEEVDLEKFNQLIELLHKKLFGSKQKKGEVVHSIEDFSMSSEDGKTVLDRNKTDPHLKEILCKKIIQRKLCQLAEQNEDFAANIIQYVQCAEEENLEELEDTLRTAVFQDVFHEEITEEAQRNYNLYFKEILNKIRDQRVEYAEEEISNEEICKIIDQAIKDHYEVKESPKVMALYGELAKTIVVDFAGLGGIAGFAVAKGQTFLAKAVLGAIHPYRDDSREVFNVVGEVLGDFTRTNEGKEELYKLVNEPEKDLKQVEVREEIQRSFEKELTMVANILYDYIMIYAATLAPQSGWQGGWGMFSSAAIGAISFTLGSDPSKLKGMIENNLEAIIGDPFLLQNLGLRVAEEVSQMIHQGTDQARQKNAIEQMLKPSIKPAIVT